MESDPRFQTYSGLTIRRMTQGDIPKGIPFLAIKNAVLGKKYTLELVFATTEFSEQLHKQFKKKDGPATVLSWETEKNKFGQMVMHLGSIRGEAKNFGHTYRKHLTFLFIHGCVHLLGHEHGKTMDALEARFHTQFLAK